MNVLTIAIVVTLAASSGPAAPITREYLLGDIDGIHYDGLGSVDDVYVAPCWLGDYGEECNFDYASINVGKPGSFVFPLESGEEFVAASVTVGLRALDSLITTDGIWLDPPVIDEAHRAEYWRFFSDLGWLPVSFTGSDTRSVAITEVFGEEGLALLQDGQFNICINDDCIVDYAILTIEVVPEPATLLLLGVGGLLLRRRGRWRCPTSSTCRSSQ